jgi:hypothetical protein
MCSFAGVEVQSKSSASKKTSQLEYVLFSNRNNTEHGILSKHITPNVSKHNEMAVLASNPNQYAHKEDKGRKNGADPKSTSQQQDPHNKHHFLFQAFYRDKTLCNGQVEFLPN